MTLPAFGNLSDVSESDDTHTYNNSNFLMANDENDPDQDNQPPQRTQSVYSRATSARSLNIIGEDDSDKEDGKSMLSAIIKKPMTLGDKDGDDYELGDGEPLHHTGIGVAGPSSYRNGANDDASPSNGDTSCGDDEDEYDEDDVDNTNEDSSKLDTATTSSNYSNNQYVSAAMNTAAADSAALALRQKKQQSQQPLTGASARSAHSAASHKSNASQTPIADSFSREFASKNQLNEKHDITFTDDDDDDDDSDDEDDSKNGDDKFAISKEYGRRNRAGSVSSMSTVHSEPSSGGKSYHNSPWYKKPVVFVLIFLGVVLLASMGVNIFFGVRESNHHKDDFVPSNYAGGGRTGGTTGKIGQGKEALNNLFPDGRVKITRHDAEVKRVLNDPKLHQVFWGVDYAPLNVQYPSCGANQREVTLDIALLSQVTNRIRLYGTDCRQAEYVLNAIMDLELNMTLSLGVWLDRNQEGNARALNEMQKLVLRYPSRYIDSILVGNEVLFREDMTEHELTVQMVKVRNYLKMNQIEIPVGTSDIGSRWTPRLASAVDVLAANIHPFFGGVQVQESTAWTYQFLYEKVLSDIDTWTHVPETMLISEVGWPSGGGRLWGSVAGIKEQQQFLNEWVCAKEATDKVGWYWFEAFDEPWKVMFHDGDKKWETQWGLFTANRKLKEGITLPNCPELIRQGLVGASREKEEDEKTDKENEDVEVVGGIVNQEVLGN